MEDECGLGQQCGRRRLERARGAAGARADRRECANNGEWMAEQNWSRDETKWSRSEQCRGGGAGDERRSGQQADHADQNSVRLSCEAADYFWVEADQIKSSSTNYKLTVPL